MPSRPVFLTSTALASCPCALLHHPHHNTRFFSAAEEWAADEPPPPAAPKEGPNMGLSGKLAAETNKTADGTAELKFQAPAEARVCKKPVWKLFVYKGDDMVGDPIPLTQLPFYMFGKDRKVADIPTDHPSCSRQHAVLVFRCVWNGSEGGGRGPWARNVVAARREALLVRCTQQASASTHGHAPQSSAVVYNLCY